MKTYRIYTPWNSLTVEAKNEKQAKIDAVKQLLYEIETHGVDALVLYEIETHGVDALDAEVEESA